MLTELSIRNLAVIESVQVTFGRGFHVLTGETGAGKSIVIDALSLLAGGRSSADLVRHGCDKAEMEAMFELPAGHPVWLVLERLGIEASQDEPLLIRRDITAQGKSTSRVNGQLVNLTMLREIGDLLVNIHGQHEHQSLLRSEQHLEWLDAFGGDKINQAKSRYDEHYSRYSSLRKQYAELEAAAKDGLRLSDLYRFQLQEIDAAAVKTGEDESLSEEKRKLANAEKLYAGVSDAYEAMFGGRQGLETITKALGRLESALSYDQPSLKPLYDQMQNAYYQLEDAVHELRRYRDGIEFNPSRLDDIEDRLAVLAGLRRKYGATAEDILQYAERIRTELDHIDRKDEKLAELQTAINREKEKLLQAGASLSEARKAAAERLSASIEKHLADLHMERTRFQARLEPVRDQQFSRHGLESAEFLIAPNPGEPMKPLHKIASGGELSRVMLAMKSIFAAVDQIPVLVFDEVDTGVSGRAAQAIAMKLSQLAGDSQVFSITHLPQVACMADQHYVIRKQLDHGRTYTTVDMLGDLQREEELARLLGGVEITETTLTHAKEMLQLAAAAKGRN